jgi:hypothetical protein
MVLACSRHLFLRPVLTMDQAAWTQSHVEAFAFLDGVPARLVPDNLRTGMERADMYDPLINRSYAELAAHYGVLFDPARADVAVRVHQSIGSAAPRGQACVRHQGTGGRTKRPREKRSPVPHGAGLVAALGSKYGRWQ